MPILTLVEGLPKYEGINETFAISDRAREWPRKKGGMVCGETRGIFRGMSKGTPVEGCGGCFILFQILARVNPHRQNILHLQALHLSLQSG